MNSALLDLLVVFGMGLVLWAVIALGTWLIRVGLRRRKPTASGDRSQSRVVLVRTDEASHGAASDHAEMPVITAADHRELMEAIIAARKLGMDDGWTGLLQEKLVHATIVPRNDLPPSVITMHTRAELVDAETNERLVLMLVYPVDANIAEGRISIFHPLGAAMLGRRVGEQVEWQVPHGVRRFEVSAVQFQPEAVLALAA